MPSVVSTARVQMRPVISVAAKGSASPICTLAGGCAAIAVPEGEAIVAGDAGETSVYHLGPAVVTGEDIVQAQARSDPISGWSVEYQLSQRGTTAFSVATLQAFGRPTPQNEIAILVDGIVVAAPQVQAQITAGKSAIYGLTEDEARRLADLLGGEEMAGSPQPTS
jgi:preprotein translocase subunit SecD